MEIACGAQLWNFECNFFEKIHSLNSIYLFIPHLSFVFSSLILAVFVHEVDVDAAVVAFVFKGCFVVVHIFNLHSLPSMRTVKSSIFIAK